MNTVTRRAARRIPSLLSVVAAAGLLACTTVQEREVEEDDVPDEEMAEIQNRLADQMADLDWRQERMRELADDPTELRLPDPIAPEYDPLEDIMVSLEMDRTDIRHILQALADETDMNLMIHPSIIADPPRMSVSFRDMPASTVFRRILESADLHGQIDDNLLYVTPNEEAVFNIDFLEVDTNADFSAGGSVLGGGGAVDDATGELSGRFAVRGRGGTEMNPYDQLERALSGIITDGSYQLHRMSGVLRIHGPPSEVETARDLIERYKRVLGQQILIEARILEVRLHDEFQAGVNWGAVRSRASASFGIEGQTLGTPQEDTVPGIQFDGGQVGDTDATGLAVGARGTGASAILNLLEDYGSIEVVSNPTIRAKHGQPSVISVGRSQAYIAETDVTLRGTGADVTQTFSVDTDAVFDGLIVGVLPFITSDGRISLSIHPVQSDVDQDSIEQLVEFGGDEDDRVGVTLPQVDLKEVSTQLDLEDNDTVILGGLISRTTTEEVSQVPFLGSIPFLGALFRERAESDRVEELVIMLNVRRL